MSLNLSDKKILFLGIGFYDYEDAIQKELEELGANVTYFSDKFPSEKSLIFKIFANLTSLNIDSIRKRYYAGILRRVKNDAFDYVLVIKGELLPETFISTLRVKLKKAHFIMYQWDALIRVPTAINQFTYFDKVFSFDRVDCLNYSELNFRPLFYREQSTADNLAIKFDISFVGLQHSNRLAFIKKLSSWCDTNKLNYFFYLTTGIYSYFKKLFSGEGTFLHINKISYKRVTEIFMSSKSILDLPNPLQVGLTMRTIEAVGFKKKIITTNQDIVNYDFYNKNNILVINDDFSGINKDFINSEYSPIPGSVLNKYSLRSWVSDVFQV